LIEYYKENIDNNDIIFQKSSIKRKQIPFISILQFMRTSFTIYILTHTTAPCPSLHNLRSDSLLKRLPNSWMWWFYR